ncbi:MAG: MFS transporter [Alysiella sp.]|uniref:MFS transporter n=1 Tax=Alysiella sp. TaxID=1872483 RepID=UPI0026DB30AF|nr:MFS transporter [Alysiella sp.]MDO4433490.1 MFS transporter [Alysiella sp.]
MPVSNRFYALFTSVFLLFAGFGLFLNSAGVKLSQMGVSNIAIGTLNAAFFCGASLSAVAAHRIVSNVGHIRSFSVFGAVFAMCSLAHLMTENLYAWGVLRTVLGFCYFSMLMVVESWFAEQSTPQKRAKVLAIYNLVYYFAFTLGILLLSLNLSSDNIFVLGTLLVMAAMLPVTLTRMKAPELPPRQSIRTPRVFAIAPLAFVTAFCGGILVNGLFTMASVFLLQQSLNLQQISAFLTSAMVGGFLVQLPIAKLSDRFGRRNAILVCAAFSALGAIIGLFTMLFGYATPILHNGVAFAFGCGLFALYALSIARANDRLPNNMNTVEVSRSLLFCYGLGSLAAPILLGLITDFAPQYGFYAFYAVVCVFLSAFTFRQPAVPQDERSVFVQVPAAAATLSAELDPRNEVSHQDFDIERATEHITYLTKHTVPQSETSPENQSALNPTNEK